MQELENILLLVLVERLVALLLRIILMVLLERIPIGVVVDMVVAVGEAPAALALAPVQADRERNNPTAR